MGHIRYPYTVSSSELESWTKSNQLWKSVLTKKNHSSQSLPILSESDTKGCNQKLQFVGIVIEIRSVWDFSQFYPVLRLTCHVRNKDASATVEDVVRPRLRREDIFVVFKISSFMYI